ncbi:acid protease [Amylostereum chailletii]|nr:acid protease [Amylostereum chailletii]
MERLAALLFLLLANNVAASDDVYTSRAVSLTPTVQADAVSLSPAPFVLNLSQKVARPSDKAKALRHIAKKSPKHRAHTDTAVVFGTAGDEEYSTNITIGGQSFSVIVDTGSSDTWLAKKGFACFNLDDTPATPEDCGFGTTGFVPADSPTFEAFLDHNFNISYADGEFLTGDVGFDTVTVGGLTVTHQEIGVVDNAAWFGDGVTTGLMGLCYPGLTSVYSGDDPDDDSSSNSDEYNPFFFSAIAEGAVSEPIMSVALNRGSVDAEAGSTIDPNLGFLAFGGIAPVNVTSTAVTVPIQGQSVGSSPNKAFFFYTVDIDAYVFPGSSALSTNGTSILDTGTTLLYVPTPIANAYHAQFDPPATFSDEEGAYIVSCNATVPPFSVIIGGTTFNLTSADVILPVGTDDDGNLFCISGIDDGGPAVDGNIFVLGDTFLHNVVATFNLGTNQVTLTERAPY